MFLSFVLLLAGAADPSPSTVEAASPAPLAPATNPGSWVTNDDYPAAAMRDEREGVTGFRLTVGPDGLPQRCEVIASSGHVDLDTTTCRLLMERARFQTRRDDKGVRIGGTYTNRIRWQIPDDYLEQLARSGFQLDATRTAWPRGPIPDPATVILDPADHYPAAALAARQEGDVRMTLDIDATGKVTGCTVVTGTMVRELDNAACALMRSDGQFQPALDSAGKPTKSTVPATFNWVLPRQGADGGTTKPAPALRKFPMSDAGAGTMTAIVGADGAVSDCKLVVTGSFAAQEMGQSPCDTIGGSVRYIPFVDVAGRSVARKVTMRTELLVEDVEAAKPPARK